MPISVNAALLKLVDLRLAFEGSRLSEEDRTIVLGEVQELFNLIHVHGSDAPGIENHFGRLRKFADEIPQVTAFGDFLHIL